MADAMRSHDINNVTYALSLNRSPGSLSWVSLKLTAAINLIKKGFWL